MAYAINFVYQLAVSAADCIQDRPAVRNNPMTMCTSIGEKVPTDIISIQAPIDEMVSPILAAGTVTALLNFLNDNKGSTPLSGALAAVGDGRHINLILYSEPR